MFPAGSVARTWNLCLPRSSRLTFFGEAQCFQRFLSSNGHVGDELLQRVPEVAASTGSACHEGKVSQSPVLCAMGVRPEVGQGAVRLTVGRFTTEEEIDRAAEALLRAARG